MTERIATCSCGQLKAVCQGEPARISVCHCLACQRRTGSAFGAQARFARENVMITGESKLYVRVAESGNKVEFRFCPTCGAIVYWSIDAAPDITAVPLGAFADPSFPPPHVSVYDELRHPWVRFDEKTPMTLE